MNKSGKPLAIQAFEKSNNGNKIDSPLLIEKQSTLSEDLAQAMCSEPLKK